MNMRRTLKKPCLRMEDGGSTPAAYTADMQSHDRIMAAGARAPGYTPMNAMPAELALANGGEVSPWSLRGIGRSVQTAFTKTPQQQADAAAKADYVARASAERAAPAVAAPPTLQATQNEFNGVGLAGRMKAAGLRDGGDLKTGHGGHVPGTGSGDKIPAKYEPGEFVVSNDMLDAQPELRQHLRGLREEVLAEKGMTPAQADAKAVGGGTLQADGGYDGGRWNQQTELDRGQRTLVARAPTQPLGGHESRVNSGLGNISPGAEPRVGLDAHDMRPERPLSGIAPGMAAAPIQGAEDFTKPLSTVPAQLPTGLRDGMVYKTKSANGTTTYSGRNVSGDVSDKMLNGDGTSAGPMRGSLRVSAGAPTFGPNGSYVTDDQAPTGAAKQAAITASLRNPDGSTWTAQDNAIMAANLRDGVDTYRGTSRQPTQDSEERIPAVGEFGHNKAVAAKLARDQLKATLRGQDITSADNRYGHELSTEVSRNRLRYDMGKDQRDYQASQANTDFTHKQASEKAWSEQIQQAHTSTVDGKPVVDQAGANATMGAMQTMVANQVKALRASGTPEDLRRAKNLADNGVHAIDPAIRGQVIAATKLAAKVNADSSNINPLKPDPLGTVDPMDLMGMKRNSSGDWITRNGKVIPNRYLAKEGADRFLGTPTNEFDILKGQ